MEIRDANYVIAEYEERLKVTTKESILNKVLVMQFKEDLEATKLRIEQLEQQLLEYQEKENEQ